MSHSAATRLAISAGARRPARRCLTRAHYRRAITALVRIGYTDYLRTPQIRERALREALERIATATDPCSPEGAAVRAVLARTPQAFSMFLRRNPDFANPKNKRARATNTSPARPSQQHAIEIYHSRAPGVQQPHGLYMRDICRDPMLLNAAMQRVELTRGRDPQARYLQVIAISGRHTVDAFWRAPIELDLRHIAHNAHGAGLVLIGLGRWFRPAVSDSVLAGCIVPADNIQRSASAECSPLDLQPLNVVADWLRSREPRA